MEEQKSKLNLYRVLSAFLAVLLLVIIYSVFWGPIKNLSASLTPARTVTVNAEGKVVATPDIAKISFSVVSQGASSKTIADANNKKMTAAINFVKAQGVDEKDIQTTQYNLSPIYTYDDKTRRSYITGYSLTQTVLVKVRDLTKVSDILGGLPALGINQIGTISFDVENPDKYMADARNQAFDKANKKAQSMADKNGVRLGRIISFSEYQNGPIPYYSKTLGMTAGAEAAATPTIQPGTQEVKMDVSITYEIR